MNSCLQCLSHTKPFRRYFLSLEERQGLQRRPTIDFVKGISISLRKRKHNNEENGEEKFFFFPFDYDENFSFVNE